MSPPQFPQAVLRLRFPPAPDPAGRLGRAVAWAAAEAGHDLGHGGGTEASARGDGPGTDLPPQAGGEGFFHGKP